MGRLSHLNLTLTLHTHKLLLIYRFCLQLLLYRFIINNFSSSDSLTYLVVGHVQNLCCFTQWVPWCETNFQIFTSTVRCSPHNSSLKSWTHPHQGEKISFLFWDSSSSVTEVMHSLKMLEESLKVSLFADRVE